MTNDVKQLLKFANNVELISLSFSEWVMYYDLYFDLRTSELDPELLIKLNVTLSTTLISDFDINYKNDYEQRLDRLGTDLIALNTYLMYYNKDNENKSL